MLFGIALLRNTLLTFVIHDSAIIKTLAFAPGVTLLEVYDSTAELTNRANEPKQVFFCTDAAKAYGTSAEKP